MRQQIFKIMGLLAIMILLFSIIGCSSNTDSKVTTSHNVKSTEVKADKEKKSQTPTKQDENQVSAPEATSQQNTAAAGADSNVQAAPPANQAVTKTVPNAKPSSPAVSAQPDQSKLTANKGTSQAATSTPPAAPVTKPASVKTVKISIIGPKDRGTIMNSTTVNIKDGETILNVLLDAAKGKVDVDYTGSGATAYVRGIDGIYERDYGAMSGWICKQNGIGIPKSAGAIQVNAGDQIEWIYKEN